jgi:hypothetical protein
MSCVKPSVSSQSRSASASFLTTFAHLARLRAHPVIFGFGPTIKRILAPEGTGACPQPLARFAAVVERTKGAP